MVVAKVIVVGAAAAEAEGVVDLAELRRRRMYESSYLLEVVIVLHSSPF